MWCSTFRRKPTFWKSYHLRSHEADRALWSEVGGLSGEEGLNEMAIDPGRRIGVGLRHAVYSWHGFGGSANRQ